MKKQSGFTLIELMVVMAIIAILATAGLAAYTGYIKKARDTNRIAAVSQIRNIVVGSIWTAGTVPATAALVQTAVTAANNGVPLTDPSGTAAVCVTWTSTTQACGYTYRVCDNGNGFAVWARFESVANRQLMADDEVLGALAAPRVTAGVTAAANSGFTDADWFEVGSCIASCDITTVQTGCPTQPGSTNNIPTFLSNNTAATSA